jgi:tight adherence protein C
MIAGALASCLAVLCAVAALTPAGGGRAGQSALIRVSTLSPTEWRQFQESHASAYQRWLRPALLLWARRLRLQPAGVDARLLQEAGFEASRLNGVELQALRIFGAGLGVIAGASLGLLYSTSILLLPLLAWAGFLLPLVALRRVRRRRQALIRSELPDLIGIVRAFYRAGVPLERTLHLVASQRASFPLLGVEIERGLAGYGLGLSLDDALRGVAARTGLCELSLLVGTLVQAGRLGSGLDEGLKEHEDAARAAQRNQAAAEASRVGTKLLAILTLVYLPEFALLIVIPLFVGLLQHAFG